MVKLIFMAFSFLRPREIGQRSAPRSPLFRTRRGARTAVYLTSHETAGICQEKVFIAAISESFCMKGMKGVKVIKGRLHTAALRAKPDRRLKPWLS
jgi:hypothetical protein